MNQRAIAAKLAMERPEMARKLAAMTLNQLDRLYRNLWDRHTRYDGYQPFGYDWETVWITAPERFNIFMLIKWAAQPENRPC